MIFKGLLLILTFFFLKGSAQELPIVERIQALEEKRGYYSKKERVFHALIGGELLYWKADVDGVAYATTLGRDIKTRTPHFSYDPGFRILVGVQSPYDLFDAVLVWTRFYTEGHDRGQGSDIGLIKPFTAVPNQTSAECCLKGNLLDLQLGRGMELSRDFFFRPYFGVRAVWSDVDWKIFSEASNQQSSELKVDNSFRAVGGLFGVFVDWKLPRGFGIATRAAGALVYGRTKEATHQEFIDAQIEQRFRAHNSFHSIKGLWELFGGVYWQSAIAKPKKYRAKRPHFLLRIIAGYELQQWPLIAQKTNVQPLRQRDQFTLGFQGFTGGIWLVF
ncbi:MAG: Lpg1974 family pore-forming outer membrane protein [Rhabdochlamydiaceae bacterium]